MDTQPKIDILQLGFMNVPLRIILNHLSTPDAISLSSTNKKLRNLCIVECSKIKQITINESFDFDVLCRNITQSEIDMIHRVFPKLRKISINLSKAENHFLDNIRKFQNLEKLTVQLETDDINHNRFGLNVKNITIKSKLYNSRADSIYNFLWQVRGTKTISVFNCHLGNKFISLIRTRNLKKFKIRDCLITNPISLTNAILDMNELNILQLTTRNLLISPFPCYVMSDIILNLIYQKNFPITKLTFTVDHNPSVTYSNLRYLKNLCELTIYYNIQNCNANLERLIYHSASLKNVSTTFIEFIESNKFFSRTTLNICERKSYYYRNIIESMDNYLAVIPLDYDRIRKELKISN